jgi:hypothetical protein
MDRIATRKTRQPMAALKKLFRGADVPMPKKHWEEYVRRFRR